MSIVLIRKSWQDRDEPGVVANINVPDGVPHLLALSIQAVFQLRAFFEKRLDELIEDPLCPLGAEQLSLTKPDEQVAKRDRYSTQAS